MRSFLHYIQHDQMDCGSTCLRMVAAHYVKRYSCWKDCAKRVS